MLNPLAFGSFAIFMACAAAQFWFGHRVRIALIDRHPAEFMQISRKAVFQDHAMIRFCWSGRHRELNDPELSKRVREMRALFGVGIASWAVFFFTLASGHGFLR